jgi:hypothetical protein
MKQLKFKSIKTRLTYWFLLLSLIPLLATLGITYYQQVKTIESATFDKLTAIRDLKKERLIDWLDERKKEVTVVSQDELLKSLGQIINKASYDQNDFEILDNDRQILNRYLSNYQDYNEISVINPVNGKVLISTKAYVEGEDKSKDDYFVNAIQARGLVIKDIYFSKAISNYSMTYSIPIFDQGKPGQNIVGVLVAHIDLHQSFFNMLAERVGLGETGETLIVNQDLVALNGLRWYENAQLNLEISAEPAVKSARGETGIAATQDYRGEPILAAYTFIPQMKWGFVCKQDMKELNIPIQSLCL